MSSSATPSNEESISTSAATMSDSEQALVQQQRSFTITELSLRSPPMEPVYKDLINRFVLESANLDMPYPETFKRSASTYSQGDGMFPMSHQSWPALVWFPGLSRGKTSFGSLLTTDVTVNIQPETQFPFIDIEIESQLGWSVRDGFQISTLRITADDLDHNGARAALQFDVPNSYERYQLPSRAPRNFKRAISNEDYSLLVMKLNLKPSRGQHRRWRGLSTESLAMLGQDLNHGRQMNPMDDLVAKLDKEQVIWFAIRYHHDRNWDIGGALSAANQFVQATANFFSLTTSLGPLWYYRLLARAGLGDEDLENTSEARLRFFASYPPPWVVREFGHSLLAPTTHLLHPTKWCKFRLMLEYPYPGIDRFLRRLYSTQENLNMGYS